MTERTDTSLHELITRTFATLEARDLEAMMSVFADDAVVVIVNEQAAALFGYSPEELHDQRLEMLLPEELYEVHTAHREHYFAAPRTRSMGAGLQLFGQHKNGTEFPVDISLRPVLLDDKPLVIGAIRDMTEQRRAELERMQQAEQIRLQAELIELAHDAIIIRDSLSRVIFWNKGAEELYGWSSQLTNLLSNAIKYSPQGGPIKLSLREEVEPHVALLSIQDQGIGIPVGQQARIFGRFMRAENARTSEISGTGLGLYLSRELVERHGGHLWFESAEGKGSTFFMTLPLL